VVLVKWTNTKNKISVVRGNEGSVCGLCHVIMW